MSEWNTPKSVAVESLGFWAAAPVWKKKGVTYILLTSEQMGWITRFFPEKYRWYLDGYEARSRKVNGYPPHKWLGYSEQSFDAGRDACPIGTSRGDLIVDAAAVLALMTSVESAVECFVVNGTRAVTALLQAAAGVAPTGRAIKVLECEPCEGRGSLGDYARGTGKQCPTCGGSGEVRAEVLKESFGS